MTDLVLAPRLFSLGQSESTSDDYYTPPWLFDRLGLTFDLDVCAPPGGVAWVPAARYYTLTEDGLSQPWQGRVWMNPPFSKPSPWADRFLAHRHGVMIFPHSMGKWISRLWAEVDGWVVVPPPVSFTSDGRPIPLPVSMAAFGDECVDAIGRVGPVRRLG